MAYPTTMAGTDGQRVIDLHSVEKVYRGKVNALRGVAMDGRVPILYMIGLLSRERDKDPRESRHSMVRYCEPLLDTFGVPHARLEGPDDVRLIPEYYRRAWERRGPAAVLVGLETS